MLPSPYTCVLWDVDGTIADATGGIFPRLRAVLASYGRDDPDPETLSRWVGPPMFESFQALAGMDAKLAEEALARYRALASEDGYAASVTLYPGIAELIRDVNAAGVPQSTASSKPEVQVRAILERFDLIDSFAAVSGARSGWEGRHDGKSEVIGWALERLSRAGADVSAPVLIGDRHHDIDGAAQYGIPVIFSTWGFGTEQEGDAAAHRVRDADALRALLLP